VDQLPRRGPGDYSFQRLTSEESTWWGVARYNHDKPGCFLVDRYADDREADKAATARPPVTVDWRHPSNGRRGTSTVIPLVMRRRGQARWYFAATGWDVPL
jgi:hypothetical protein